MSGTGHASGADTTSSPGGRLGGVGGVRLGQLLRQKRWHDDSRLVRQSGDSQVSVDNMLADEDGPPPGKPGNTSPAWKVISF